MAIITLARQVAAKGDEVAQELAAKLGYSFITRKQIEERILELGFPAAKLPKYDERKPGFFASMAKDRDAYQNLSQYAMLEAASKGNIIIIGRGAFALFASIPNHISVRLIASEKVRISRLMEEFEWDEKQARQHIQESDTNRSGFHKNFYNIDIDDPANFHMFLNTGTVSINDCANIIADFTRAHVTPTKEAEGSKLIEEMLKAQTVVNKLIFDYKIGIDFLHATIEDGTFVLYGVTDAPGLVEQALEFVRKELPEYPTKSAVSIVHDFKQFQ
ncbi:MAG: cytidylate kinase-like family protein [Treponema sp.]|nr:cytidylate kinase-like family protein [Treponema sp.]